MHTSKQSIDTPEPPQTFISNGGHTHQLDEIFIGLKFNLQQKDEDE
jgi:hypothetical protein